MNKINLFYTHLDKNNYPLHPNGLNLDEKWFGNRSVGFLDHYLFIMYGNANINLFNYTNDTTVNSILPLNLLKNPRYWFGTDTGRNELIQIFKKLPITQLQNGNIKLFLYDGHEGNNYSNFINEIKKFFSELNIEFNNIIIGSANYAIYQNRDSISPINLFFLNYFILDSYSLNLEIQSFLTNINQARRPHKILSLNRVPKLHRAIISLFLFKNKNSINPLFSMPGDEISEIGKQTLNMFTSLKNNPQNIPEKYSNELINTIDDLIAKLPSVIDRSDFDTNFFNIHSKQMYENSYFNIVNESLFYEKEIFISEKLFKPILNYQPFIISGSPGVLKLVKSLGFETFPEIFDEGYDEIEDNKLRMEKLLDNLTDLSKKSMEQIHKIYLDSQDKLIYNRSLITNSCIENPLNDIFNIFESFINGRSISNTMPRYFK